MEVNTIDGACHLVEADVVKSLEACTGNLPDAVIWDQEFLLPSHEHVFTIRAVLIVEVGLLCLFCQGPPGGETGPMLHVLFVAGAPITVTCLEGVLRTNDFAFEESRKGRVFRSKAFDG